MIDTLILSKGNRMMQLDLLIRSLNRHDEQRQLQRILVDDPPQDFERAVRTHLQRATELVCFLVDDGFFYSPLPKITDAPTSLRPGDYDYLFTLDAGIYESAQVLAWLDGHHFSDPTQLEAGVASLVDGQSFPEGSQFPCFVGVPHNRVSPSSGMPTMGGSAEELQRLYEDGQRIDLDAMIAQVEAADVITPHMALEYVYR